MALTDVDGNPLNPKDKTVVKDMTGPAIERRENVELTQAMMQSAMDSYVRSINPLLVGHKPQLLSEAWPLHNMVVCKPQQISNESKGGIHFDPNILEKQETMINDAIGYIAVKCGPECVNVKEGDTIFQSSPTSPILIPLIDDVSGDNVVRKYHCFAENWLSMVLRTGGKKSQFTPYSK